jgi:hypothetical protein
MVEQTTKNKLLLLELMLVIGVLVFVGAFAVDRIFPTGTVAVNGDTLPIVGFVPVEIKSQPIDLVAKEPTSFVVFSEKDEQYSLTSLRLSGTVTGEGRAEILLDNGLGQELLIYTNVKQKKGNLITGMSVSEDGEPLPEDAEIVEIAPQQAWFKITPSEKPLGENPAGELGDDRQAIPGEFQHSCVDTCYMNMVMKKGLFYTMKIRVDAGTEVNINELKYMLDI